MRRFFSLMLGALAMLAVALISAFVAMRLAIHGREVEVPALTGLTLSDASRLAAHDGLNLTLENRFYSADIPAGRVLAQAPAPGTKVRRDWTVRITESLGAQRVSVPDLEGKSERAATISLRRLSLEPGVIAHLPIAGDPDVVIAQTPEANAGGVTGPRVSLLISDPPDAVDQTYVMPQLVGLMTTAASARAAAMGLRVMTEDPGQRGAVSMVVAQSPMAGHRVGRGDMVHLAVGAPGGSAGQGSATQSTPQAATPR